LLGTKLLTIEYCLKNVTKRFIVLFCCYFSFSCLIVLVVLVKVFVGIFPSLREVWFYTGPIQGLRGLFT